MKSIAGAWRGPDADDVTGDVVITGGSGGLGAAIARSMVSPGLRVHALSSTDLDVRDAEAVRNWFAGREVALLVCAAGIVRDAPLARLHEEAWDEVMRVCLDGARFCAREVLPGMAERKTGHVVFISSHSAIHPPAGQAAYAAAKAALLGLTTDLACRFGTANVRVNSILPGFLETAMTSEVSDRRRGEVLDAHTLRRFNTCEAVAEFVRFLHEHMPHTSGQVFQLDSRPGGARFP